MERNNNGDINLVSTETGSIGNVPKIISSVAAALRSYRSMAVFGYGVAPSLANPTLPLKAARVRIGKQSASPSWTEGPW
jgi:hypothetical protein